MRGVVPAVLVACACASGRARQAAEPMLSATQRAALCVELAHLSYDCPEEFVDAHLDASAHPQPRAELLRQLRVARTRPELELRARCAERASTASPAPLALLHRIERCEQRAACSLKIECARPVLTHGVEVLP